MKLIATKVVGEVEAVRGRVVKVAAVKVKAVEDEGKGGDRANIAKGTFGEGTDYGKR